jgi:hypothetical protein
MWTDDIRTPEFGKRLERIVSPLPQVARDPDVRSRWVPWRGVPEPVGDED